MRDTMAARGPDGHGLWSCDWATLAHRRLAVVDLSPDAAQPMLSPDGLHALVYNGELYNDADLRRELAAAGAVFRTRCDTETVLRALMHAGAGALPQMRGMYALGWLDQSRRTLLLARDPLGIKPLYYAVVDGGRELVFASDIRAILAHPLVPARPDPVAVSAYLTTIRTVMGERTLFSGVRMLRPGHGLEIDASAQDLRIRRFDQPIKGQGCEDLDPQIAAERIRRAVTDSVRRHLRSDVPVCALLSGGLDSTVIASLLAADLGPIRTYCSGAEGPTGLGEDFDFARLVAGRIGSAHTDVPISRERFAQRWGEMVAELGVPLSTPNEVAIADVCARLRADGNIVALSGEGADELFAGYAGPMAQAAAYESSPLQGRVHPGEFQLNANAWVLPALKPSLLSQAALRATESDAALVEYYRDEFDRTREFQGEPLQAHLLFQRRINLAGLLQRLDTASMLASVEGRTPFADRVVCALAESLPMAMKYTPASADHAARTKTILRLAFADMVPAEVIRRPKASFPLPFQEWVADSVRPLRDSAFARELFSPAAIDQIASNPAQLWNLAWPAINLAMWGQRWWG
jgi:asparagine synthase (glutamine-hydrolysing)